MSTDPFEQHFQQWLQGVAWEAKTQQEERNLNTLVRTLRERGYVVKLEPPYYIQVNPDTPMRLTITARNAREMEPAQLLVWVEEHLRFFAREMEARQWREEEREALELATQTTMTPREAKFFLWLLDDWKRNHPLSNEEVANIKQSAIASAVLLGESPVSILQAMYGTYVQFKEKQVREGFIAAMQFQGALRKLEREAGMSVEGLKSLDVRAWLDAMEEEV